MHGSGDVSICRAGLNPQLKETTVASKRKKGASPKVKMNQPAHQKSRTKKTGKPCISSNTNNSSAKIGGSDGSKNLHGNDRPPTNTISNIKNHTKYDLDFEDSRALHRATCKAYGEQVREAYGKRRFKLTDMQDFDALLGKGDRYADHMPASDLSLRQAFGEFLIDEVETLFKLIEADPSLAVVWMTFVGDRYMLNEREGEAKVNKVKQAVQATIRNYTSFNAIGIIENQAIVNYPKYQEGKTLSVHAHVLCWGTSADVSKLKKRAKGFKSSITRIPIHTQKVHRIEGSFGRLARYMVKPPFEGKEVNYEKLEKGEKCLFPARRVEKYHHLRLFEYGSKLPMEHTLFGVRKGKKVRGRIVNRLKKWHHCRPGEQIEMGCRVDTLFRDFLKDNKGRLGNYKPLKVSYRS